MASIKDDVRELLNSLPDDISFEDLVEALIIRQKIQNGLTDSVIGNYYSQEEAKTLLEKWLQ
jgi:hypothetical protein